MALFFFIVPTTPEKRRGRMLCCSNFSLALIQICGTRMRVSKGLVSLIVFPCLTSVLKQKRLIASIIHFCPNNLINICCFSKGVG